MNPHESPDASSGAHFQSALAAANQQLSLSYFYPSQPETSTQAMLLQQQQQVTGMLGLGEQRPEDRKRQTKACDGCRTRKRKCDGLSPCSNCQKSMRADGTVTCTYTAVPKKRGPKKGHKDTLLQRLESLESMLKPLTSAMVTTNSAPTSSAASRSASPQITVSPSINHESPTFHQSHGRPSKKRAHIEDRLSALVNVAEASITSRAHQQSSAHVISPMPAFSPNMTTSSPQPLLLSSNTSNLVHPTTPEMDSFEQLQEILSHDSGSSFLGLGGQNDLLYTSQTASSLPDLIPSMGDSLPMMNPEMLMNTLNIMFAPPMGGVQDQFPVFGAQSAQSDPQPLFPDASNPVQSNLTSPNLHSASSTSNPVLSSFLSNPGSSGDDIVTPVELHLIRLAIALAPLIPLTKAQLNAIKTGENVQSLLPRALRDAMCAVTAGYSKHPDLFRDFPDIIIPVLKDRVRLVKLFLARAEDVLRTSVRTLSTSSMDDFKMYQAKDSAHVTPISECDAIRAMFFMVLAYYGLGIGAEAMRFSRDACQLAIRVRLSQSSSEKFDKSEPPKLQVGSIVTRIPRMKQEDVLTRPYTTEERADRYRLWAATITMDTLATMTSGYQFAIDEHNYPDLIVGWTESSDGPVFKIPRVTLSNLVSLEPLAQNTVWQNGPLAVMYDNMMQMSAVVAEPDGSSDLYENQFKLFLILRKIIRHTWRDGAPAVVNQKSPLASYPFNQLFTKVEEPSVDVLHDSLLTWLSLLPPELKPFDHLEAFASSRDRPHLNQLKNWIFSMAGVQNILLFLSGFAYLHLPLVSQKKYGETNTAEKKFPLRPPTANGEERPLFTSREVLLSIFRAVTYVIQKLYSPSMPLEASFQSVSYDMNEVNAANLRSLPPDVASPALCWTCSCFCIFIIGVSGLLAGRTYKDCKVDSHIYPAAVAATKSVILPVLERAGEMYPLTSLFKAKLAVFLSGGSPGEWAEEAVKQ